MSELREWLDKLGLGQYADAFEENDIDESLALDLTDEALEKLGVASMGHRMKLLNAAKDSAESGLKPQLENVEREVRKPERTVAAEGQRRQATVLFSDLSGYTAMNEKLDPEVVGSLVARIKEQAVNIVEGHGGIVNQFVGDEVLALFGIPAAHEDDPVRAVRAALALHDMVRGISPQVEEGIGQPLRLHSGISSGLIVTSTRDRRDGTVGVTGDTVNVGARLKALADTDTILVGPETEHLHNHFGTPFL